MSNEKVAMFSKGSFCSQELAAASRMLDFLEACGTVQYVVMSSVAGCHDGTRYSMPNFKAKEDIETALKSRGMKWTVLRHADGQLCRQRARRTDQEKRHRLGKQFQDADVVRELQGPAGQKQRHPNPEFTPTLAFSQQSLELRN